MLLLDAYAILSPLESADSGVGCPRVVLGEAAQMASAKQSASWSEDQLDVHYSPEVTDML